MTSDTPDPSTAHLTTEARNPASMKLDQMSAEEIVSLMNNEDATVAAAVAREKESVAATIEVVTTALRSGGRLVYLGAGTSGRLGVLDAAECPPTFRTPPELVVGIIAGGSGALTRAIEGAEDDSEAAARDLSAANLSSSDVLVGIATSGRTPYVVRGLEYARSVGAFTVGLTCNADSGLAAVADRVITPIVGPEIISGSTRLKAGTATKMVLNMITTGAMVRLGKTYGNLMVDLKATNNKLLDRSIRIVQTLSDLDDQEASTLLQRCDGEVKTAIVVARCQLDPDEARTQLDAVGGQLRHVLARNP